MDEYPTEAFLIEHGGGKWLEFQPIFWAASPTRNTKRFVRNWGPRVVPTVCSLKKQRALPASIHTLLRIVGALSGCITSVKIRASTKRMYARGRSGQREMLDQKMCHPARCSSRQNSPVTLHKKLGSAQFKFLNSDCDFDTGFVTHGPTQHLASPDFRPRPPPPPPCLAD